MSSSRHGHGSRSDDRGHHSRSGSDRRSRSRSRERRQSEPGPSDDRDEYDGVLHKKRDAQLILALKHIDTFYKPQTETVDYDEKPEDCIPDLPENQAARDFLKSAPSKGLWMPLGKEVKVMQCWRCKAYGHRSGDKECPMFISGNKEIEAFRFMNEDPMLAYVTESKRKEKEEKVRQLQALLAESTSDSSSDSDISSSSESDHDLPSTSSLKRKKSSKKSSKKLKKISKKSKKKEKKHKKDHKKHKRHKH